MTALLGTVLVASLAGSPHCAGMCGAVVALATCTGGAPAPRSLHVAYHGGRLITYMMLGALAGSAGALLELGGLLLGLQRVALIFAGAGIITLGVAQLLRYAGLQLPTAPVPQWLHRFVMAGHQRSFQLPPVRRALALGLLTTLLPCGWLYAFAIAAAGTSSPLLGALVMGVFWIGTVPILLTISLGVRSLAGRWGESLRVATACALILAGTYTIAQRSALDPHEMIASLQAETTEEVIQAAAETPPCCHVEP